MTPLTLTGRLLCAAQQTYDINASGVAPVSPPTPAPPPSSLVGWTDLPKCQVTGDDDISAVLVGQTPSEIIVAYRGTEPFDSPDHERMVLDWIDNLICPLVASPNVPGSVHAGFSHGVDGLWAWVLEQVQAMPKGKPLYLTGHSKGGAMANIAAVKLVAAGFAPFVCTFEAAHAGDPAFAAGFAQRVTHAVRYEYQDDIVPHLPPNDVFQAMFKKLPLLTDVLNVFVPDYVPVGDLHFINWQDQVVGDNPALESQRFAHLMTLLTSMGCDQIIADHSIGPGSGAASVICPGVWGGTVTPTNTDAPF